MKKTLFTAAFLISSLSAFAQIQSSALSVCEDMRVRTTYTDRVNQCVQLASRNSFDSSVIGLLKAMNQKSTQETLNAMAVAANNRFDVNAVAVCSEISIRTTYTDRVTECLRISANQYFDAQITRLAITVASKSTVESNNILKVAAGASYDVGAVAVCNEINTRTTYTDRVTECARNTANQTYAPEIAELARIVASKSTVESNNILMAAANSYFMPSAVATCAEINSRTTYTDRVTSCVNTIKNKVFMNGAETFCSRMASSSTVEAINCLATSAMDYVPTPVPTPRDMIVSAQEIRDLKLELNKARKQLERGNTAQAMLSIGDALRAIEIIEANNSPRR